MVSHRPSDLLGEMYAQWAAEMSAHPGMSVQLMRMVFDDWQRATAEPEGVTYRDAEVGGVPGVTVLPERADAGQVLVFMHGGGFALGSSASHRKLAGHVAKACGARAFVPDFRRSPEHPFPAALQDGSCVLEGLLGEGHSIADLTPIGDSAGGNLAISMVLHRRDQGLALPQQVIVLSPWLDMRNGGSTLDTNDATDYLITREGLQGNIDRYLGGRTDPTNPLVNPLHADLRGFPRLYVSASDAESLFDDSVRLHALAHQHGVDVTFSVGQGMQHVFPFLAGRHPRANREIEQIGNWYRAGRAGDAGTAEAMSISGG